MLFNRGTSKKKREALGKEYKSRAAFIRQMGISLFDDEDWITEKHLGNIERGQNWISFEMFIKLSAALQQEPGELFSEIIQIYRSPAD